MARRVAEAAGLKGIFNVDFKRDPRDGTLRVLEINARYNFWLYLGAKNGLNLTKVIYDHLVARKQPTRADYSTTYRWLDPGLDMGAYRMLSRAGELGFARWAASLVFARKIYSVFSWSDPAPFVKVWRERLAHRWARGTRRLRQILSKSS
jgi:predicted ATP-grasp superfamily ATP-dependent carboligase